MMQSFRTPFPAASWYPTPPPTPGAVHGPHNFEVGDFLRVKKPELLIHGLGNVPVDPAVLQDMLNLPTHPAVVVSTSFDPEICIIIMGSTKLMKGQQCPEDAFPFQITLDDSQDSVLHLEGRLPNQAWIPAVLENNGYVKPDCIFAVHHSMLDFWTGNNMTFRLTLGARTSLTEQLNVYYNRKRLGDSDRVMEDVFRRLQRAVSDALSLFVEGRFLLWFGIIQKVIRRQNTDNRRGWNQLGRALTSSVRPDGTQLTIAQPRLIEEAMRYAANQPGPASATQITAIFKLLYMQSRRGESHTSRFDTWEDCSDLVSLLLTGFVLGHTIGIAEPSDLRRKLDDMIAELSDLRRKLDDMTVERDDLVLVSEAPCVNCESLEGQVKLLEEEAAGLRQMARDNYMAWLQLRNFHCPQ